MTLARQTTAALCACALAMAAPLSRGVVAGGLDENDVTLRGCLVKGEGDGAGYLLTNTVAAPGFARSGDSRIEPNAVGTTGGTASIFYWLDDDDGLKTNIGHEVEVTGDLEGDLEEGEITLDRKDRWTEMTVKSKGRTMKANVPNSSIYPAPNQDTDQKARVIVRKVDVDDVKMLGASCDMMR